MRVTVMAKSARTGIAGLGCALTFLLCARVATGQTPATGDPPAGPPTITYVGGQLSIRALDATLAEVLAKVSALTGAKLDVPSNASSDRMPIVELGPGPAREVLASLLDGSNLDYVIQASDADPAKIQCVTVMVREKKDARAIEAADRSARSPFGRRGSAPPEPEEAPVAENPAPAQPETTAAAEASPSAAPPDQPAQMALPSTTQPVQLVQPGLSAGAMSPPANLSSDSINPQLQQMYQQRMQMVQQERQATGAPVNPGGK